MFQREQVLLHEARVDWGRGFGDLEAIFASMKVKAVIMSHNTPVTTRALYEALSPVFDVMVMDSGSDEGQSPECPAERYANLYYTGCWNEAMRRFGDYDVVWMIGGDVKLENSPREYRDAILSALPFGIWSPVISGHCREVGAKKMAWGRVFNVYHLEGIAMAISGDMVRHIGSIPGCNRLGWGIDIWLSWIGWSTGRRNILDGRVSLFHPEGCGYSREQARKEMGEFLEMAVGPNWMADTRCLPHQGLFENNLRGVSL
jgi:hypothetical protein